MAWTEDHAGAGDEAQKDYLANNPEVPLPLDPVILFQMNSTAPNQHHNLSRPLSQKVLEEKEGREEERLWCRDENI